MTIQPLKSECPRSACGIMLKKGDTRIRTSTKVDGDAIRECIDLSFGSSRYESRLRDIVVRNVPEFYEWVVELNSRIIGHILYTPATRRGAILGYHLGPVSIHPEFQNHGLGSQLIEGTLGNGPIDKASIFVLGDPGFYERFGFEKTTTAICPYDEGNEHFRALRWQDTGDVFTIGYSPAFAEAEKS